MSWLSGWNYRKSHILNGTSGAGTNYQVKIITNYLGAYNLGHTTAETSNIVIEDVITGCVFTTTYAGTVNFIKAYLETDATFKVKCAIYKWSDSSLVTNSVTNEVSVPSGTAWINFPYSGTKPILGANTKYVIVAWAENIFGKNCYLRYHIGDVDQALSDSEVYDSFPDPASFVLGDREYSIYCELSDGGDTVYLDEKCETDFGDVRFTDDDGTTELDYWMESKTDSDTATFWVKVDDDLGSNQTIYVYYGKSGASSTSNGDNTFEFFDDFEDNSIDTTKWNEVSGTISETGGRLVLRNDGANNAEIRGKTAYAQFSIHHEIRTCVQVEANSSFARLCELSDAEAGGGNNDRVAWDQKTGETWTARAKNDGTGTTYDWQAGDTSWHELWISWYDDSGTPTAKYYEAETLRKTIATNVPTSGDIDLTPRLGYNDDANDLNVEWIFVRNFVDPEPSHGSWGNEEAIVRLMMQHYRNMRET